MRGAVCIVCARRGPRAGERDVFVGLHCVCVRVYLAICGVPAPGDRRVNFHTKDKILKDFDPLEKTKMKKKNGNGATE